MRSALPRAAARDGRTGAIRGRDAFFEREGRPGAVVLIQERLEQRMIGIPGLDQHAARALRPTGTARDLDQNLRLALAGAEVGAEEAGVERRRWRRGDARKVVPLGQHLRAAEDRGALSLDSGQRRVEVEMERVVSRSMRITGTSGKWPASACSVR